MPNNYKTLLSIIVFIVGAIVFYFEWQAGAGAAKWVVLALTPFMILAIWLFPEAKKQNGDSDRADDHG